MGAGAAKSDVNVRLDGFPRLVPPSCTCGSLLLPYFRGCDCLCCLVRIVAFRMFSAGVILAYVPVLDV